MALWRPFDVSDNEMDNVEADSMAEPSEYCNKDLHVQTQRVILNIYTCLKTENRGASQNEILKRICELTKLARTTIYTVIRAGDTIDHSVKRKRANQKLKKVDNGDKEVIRRVVYQSYEKNQVPALQMIQDKLRS